MLLLSRSHQLSRVSELPRALLHTTKKLVLVVSWTLAVVSNSSTVVGQETEVEQTMARLLDAASGRTSKFHLRAVLQVPIGGYTQDFLVDVFRDGPDFDVSLVNSEMMLTIRRREEGTALALPKHKLVFIGTGEAASDDHLGFDGVVVRMISNNCALGQFAPIMLTLDPKMVLKMAQSSMGAKIENSGKSLSVGGMEIRVTKPGQVAANISGMKLRAGITELNQPLLALDDWPEYLVEAIERTELERTLFRGLRRATEIVLPGDGLKTPYPEEREVENGKLIWIDGQRVVILHGSAQQIGRAHGELIGYEVAISIDSILHTHALLQTVTTGKWFRKDLDAMAARFQPHLSPGRREENTALASAIGQPPAVIDAINAFQETFLGSGFAITGSATTDGKPYMGRLLDRPAAIGLHDCATVFAVLPEGKQPFVHVSYAGLTGCISGMNQSQIAVSQTGFKGPPDAEGTPMTALIRTALEECSSLAEVTDLWKSSTRSGTYDTILADGKSATVLAVSTTPENLELIRPGGDHAVLGAAIEDALVVCTGERRNLLRTRITEAADKLQAESAIAIMASPVSSGTNLSNILLAPADLEMHVANANHTAPAHESDYAKINVLELLKKP